ncbi:MAG: hypothetical protein EOO73_20435 [Myxococcales bacterium]|nr:MAG: hypothetical protein EOO73_20435 [Myxococcales bacterium]
MVSARTDALAAASLEAVERALAWYADEVLLAEKPPITAAEAADLRVVLRGEGSLRPAQLEGLVRFTHTMFLVGQRTADVPTCNLGDALTALAAHGAHASARWPWRWDPTLDAEAFAKLRFSEASAGIAKIRRQNRDGWAAHASRNRAFIEQAVSGCARRDLAVVLGAGQAFDLPLPELAKAFERLVLVDIDGPTLEATISAVVKDPGLRARIEPRVMDLTGINGQLVRALEEVFSHGGDAAAIASDLSELCRSYWLPEPPALLGSNERADLLVSDLVLSQVAWPQRVHALRLYEQRFGKLAGEAERTWVLPWWELELRIQQDHITSLTGCADRIVLCSDVINRLTLVDSAGVERETGRKVFALGVSQLAERIPRALESDQHEAWEWVRYHAGSGNAPGSRMDVEGLVLRERPRTG